jgi:uncharacterized protein (TIGR03435 family)
MRILALVLLPLFCAGGEQASGAKLEFEAASVKPSVRGPGADGLCRGGPATGDPTRFTCRYVDLKRIIVRAFGLRPFQVAAPDWTDNQRLDIQAVVPAGATKEQFEAMLQNLLVDRFHLGFHRELRNSTRYELLVAEGGPKLKEAQVGEAARDPSTAPDPVKMRDLPLGKDGYPIRTTRGFTNVNGRARFYEPQGPIENLLPLLNMVMDEPVVDSTGLKGNYEIEMHWGQAPLFGQIQAAQTRANSGLSPAATVTAPDVGPGGPSIQQALHDQLGLKLQIKKGPMETVVIDRIDRAPTEN